MIKDSKGDGLTLPPGTKIIYLPDKTKGTVVQQLLHYDGGESFFGNVRLQMDDGRKIEANAWQCTICKPELKEEKDHA